MRKLKYQIGDWVVVSKVQIRDKQEDKVTWRTALPLVTTKPRLGQVVGLCTRYDGATNSDYDEMGIGGIWFEPTKSHQFWLVRFGLINKAVEVAEGDMMLVIVEKGRKLPYRWPQQKMSERDKQSLRDDSKNWPRDARGRWIAGPVVHRS